MIKKLFYAAMTVLAAAACSKENGTVSEPRQETKTICLDVSPFRVETKNTGEYNNDRQAMDSIYLLEAFVFRGDGVLEKYRRYGISEMNLVGRNNLPLDVTPGEKTIYVVANSKAETWIGATTEDKFLKLDVPLKKERFGYFTMSKMLKVDPDTATTVKVNLKRLVAKIVVNSIRTKFVRTPYEGYTLNNSKLYLTNISGNKTYMSEIPQNPLILNYKGYNQDDVANPALPSMFAENVHTSIGDSGYSTPQYFYCYENLLSEETDSQKFTRLVLETELDGKKYYYPIDINQPGYGWNSSVDHKGIRRGTIYTYDIVITGPGSDDPETKIVRKSITLDAEAESFVDGPAFTATF